MTRFLLTRRPLLAAITLAVTATAHAEPSTQPATIDVVAAGTGTDEAGALRQALSNAVTQAVGTIVDAETVVKDDQIIRDQVLTASNAIVARYVPIGSPAVDGSLVTVRIRATIERKQLTERLTRANVIARPVDGASAFAQAVTDLQREQDAAVIVRRAFDGFPGNVLKAEPVGEPRVIEKDAAEVTVGITVRFSVDMAKYAAWHKAFVPLLTKVATKSEEDRWNPQTAARPGPKVDASYFPEKGAPASFSVDDKRLSYLVNFETDSFGSTGRGAKSLAILDRQGSAKYVTLTFDTAAFDEVRRAAWSLPTAEIRLLDADGGEIDGQSAVAIFNDQVANRYGVGVPSVAHATAFWTIGDGIEIGGGTTGHECKDFYQDDAVRREFASNEITLSALAKVRWIRVEHGALLIAPYLAVGSIATPGFDYEFRYRLSLDQLKNVKKIEASISSRNVASDEP